MFLLFHVSSGHAVTLLCLTGKLGTSCCSSTPADLFSWPFWLSSTDSSDYIKFALCRALSLLTVYCICPAIFLCLTVPTHFLYTSVILKIVSACISKEQHTHISSFFTVLLSLENLSCHFPHKKLSVVFTIAKLRSSNFFTIKMP